MLREYMIERHRVILDSGIGWHCACAEFTRHNDCKHVRESHGRFAAQERIRLRVKQPHGLLTPFTNRVES